MPQWYDITRKPAYQALPDEDKIIAKQRFFEREILPKIDSHPELKDDANARQAAYVKFMQQPDDTGQGMLTSSLSGAVRGLGEIVPGVIQGAGALTGITPLEKAGEAVRGGLEYVTPINPLYQESVPVKASGVVGQVGSMLATAGAGGLAGRALAAERIAAAANPALAAANAVSKGANAALYGSAALQGAAQGAQAADQYGMTGIDRYGNILAHAASEVGTEMLPFGLGTEASAVKKLIGKSPQVGGLAKDIYSEAGEEALNQIAQNASNQYFAPEGVKTPGLTEGALEAAAYGGLGGGVMGGINVATGAYKPLPVRAANDLIESAQATSNEAPLATAAAQATNNASEAAHAASDLTRYMPPNPQEAKDFEEQLRATEDENLFGLGVEAEQERLRQQQAYAEAQQRQAQFQALNQNEPIAPAGSPLPPTGAGEITAPEANGNLGTGVLPKAQPEANGPAPQEGLAGDAEGIARNRAVIQQAAARLAGTEQGPNLNFPQQQPQTTQDNASEIQSTTPVGELPSGQESTRTTGSKRMGFGQQGQEAAREGQIQEEVAPQESDEQKYLRIKAMKPSQRSDADIAFANEYSKKQKAQIPQAGEQTRKAFLSNHTATIHGKLRKALDKQMTMNGLVGTVGSWIESLHNQGWRMAIDARGNRQFTNGNEALGTTGLGKVGMNYVDFLSSNLPQTTTAAPQTETPALTANEGGGSLASVGQPVEGSIPTVNAESSITNENESRDIVDEAVNALSNAIDSLPAVAKSKYTPEVMLKAASFFASRNTADLDGLTNIQKQKVHAALQSVDEQVAAEQDAVDAMHRQRIKDQEAENARLEKERARQEKLTESRRKAADSLVEKDANPEMHSVSVADGQEAQAILHNSEDVPGVLSAFVGTSEQFLANQSNRGVNPRLYDFVGELVRNNALPEGLFSDNRSYVFTDGIGITAMDRQNAEQLGIPASVAAARRVLIHEGLVHRGIFGLPVRYQRAILNWVKQNVTPEELDALAESYPEFSEWRTSEYAMLNLCEEFLARKVDKIKVFPKEGPLAKLLSILRDIWRWITGRSDEPSIQNLRDVVKLLKAGAQAANDRLVDGGKVDVRQSRPSYTSPIQAELARAQERLQAMRERQYVPTEAGDFTSVAEQSPVNPEAARAEIRRAYDQALLGEGSVYVPIQKLYDIAKQTMPAMTEREFGAQLQNLYESNAAVFSPADSGQGMMDARERWGAHDAAGLPASYVAIMPEFKMSRAQQDNVAKAQAATAGFAEKINEVNVSGEQVESQARQLKDYPAGTHAERSFDGMKQVAKETIDAILASGVPVSELPSILNSQEYLASLGIANDLAMQNILDAWAMKRINAEAVKAKPGAKQNNLIRQNQGITDIWNKRGEAQGAGHGMRAYVMKQPEFQAMFLEQGVMNQELKRRDEKTRSVIHNPWDVVNALKKKEAAAEKTATDDVEAAAQGLSEEDYERMGEESMDPAELSIVRRIREVNRRRGELIAHIQATKAAASGIKPSRAEKDVVSMSLAEAEAELAKLDKEVHDLVGKLKAKTAPKTKKVGTNVGTQTEEKPSPAIARLIARLEHQSGLKVDIKDALESLLPEQPSMRDQMIGNIVQGVVGRAETIAREPKKQKALKSLESQLRKILQQNVKGEQKPLPKESLGQRALKAFGYVTSNEEDVRKAWDIARAEVVDVMRKIEEERIGIPEDEDAITQMEEKLQHLEAGNTEQRMAKAKEIEDLQDGLEDRRAELAKKRRTIRKMKAEFEQRRDALMDATPRKLYAASEALSVIRESLNATGFDTTQKLLNQPEKAREAVIHYINEAVSKESDVDPARWERDQSYLLHAFDSMVSDLRKTLTANAAKRTAHLKNELFTGDQQKALKTILRKLDKARPAGSPPLAASVSWRKLFSYSQKNQEQRRQQMEDLVAQDPILQNLTQAEQKQLSDLLDAAWQKRHDELMEAEIKRLSRTQAASKSGKKALEDSTAQILELINRGVFDYDALAKVISEKYGIRGLNDTERKRLHELSEELQQENITPWKRKMLSNELRNMLADATGMNYAELAEAWWLAAVLSGPRTWFTIALGFLNGGFEILKNGIAITALNGGDTDAIKTTLQGMRNWIASMPRAFQIAVSYIKNGDVSLLDPNLGGSSHIDLAIRELGRGSVTVKLLKSANAGKRALGQMMWVVNRIMVALDLFNGYTSKYGALPLAIYLNRNIYDPQQMADATNYARVRKQVLESDFNNEEPTTLDGKARLAAWTNDKMWNDIKDFQKIEEDANYLAQLATFTMDPTGLGGKMYQTIMGAQSSTKKHADQYLQLAKEGLLNKDGLELQIARSKYALAWIYQMAAYNMLSAVGLKFARFSANKINQTLSFIPGIGFFRLHEQTEADKMHQANIIGAQIIGGFFFAAIPAILSKIGDEPDDEKRGWGIEGSWANLTPQKKSQRLSDGAKEYTIYWNGHRYNYQNWPIGGLLSALGSLSDLIKYSPDKWNEKSVANRIASGMWAQAISVADSSALSQFAELMGREAASSDPLERSMGRMGKVMSNFAGGFVPRAFKDLDMMQNPKIRTYDNVWDSTLAHIPVYRRFIGNEKLDIFGEQIAPSRMPWTREFIMQPVAPEYNILSHMNSRNIWLTPANAANRFVGKGRHRRPMTEAEADRYVHLTGQAYRDFVLTHGDRILAMTPARAKAYVSDKADEIRDRAAKKAVQHQ